MINIQKAAFRTAECGISGSSLHYTDKERTNVALTRISSSVLSIDLTEDGRAFRTVRRKR